MKRWMLIVALALSLLLTGCAPETAPEGTNAVDLTAAAQGELGGEEYPWGTSFETVKADKITEGMELGEDYALYEDTGGFAKELILNGEVEGNQCQCYYSFNDKDELVSAMTLYNGGFSDKEMTQIYLDQVKALRAQYGEPGAVGNDYDSGEYTDLETFIQDVKAEGSFCLWSDSVGNQVLVSAYEDDSRIEVLLRCSVRGYGD